MSNQGSEGDVEVLTEPSYLTHNIISEIADRAAAFRVRNSKFESRSVHPADVPEFVEKGWEVNRGGKRKSQIRRPKSHNQQLEDRAWVLLYRMGYSNLSGERFVLRFKRSSGSEGKKQIDALGYDEETAIVVECKSREERGRRSLQKDIEETRALQSYIRESINSAFPDQPKPKVIWMYVTNNIIWSDADILRARDANVYIVTENELNYFEAFLTHMGSAGRYQLLGELLKDTKIPGLTGHKIPAIRGKLGGYTFYSFVTTARDLLKVAFVNHQAFNHPDGKPAYQRMVSSTRIKEIGQYIKNGGFFPTNILANFVSEPKFELLSNKENTDSSIKFGWLTIPPKYRSLWIIDGQHRLYGFTNLDDKFLDHSLFVLAFDGMEAHKEADLFITINHKQKSVPPGLLLTLLADLRMGDPNPSTSLSALSSAVIRTINSDLTSPLSGRFAKPDVPAEPRENLTISEAVKGLKQSGLIGRVLHNKVAPGPLSAATDPETVERSRRILNGYFEAIRAAHPARWEAGRAAYICVNPGIRAHLRLIPELVAYVRHKKGMDFDAAGADDVVSELTTAIEPFLTFVKTASEQDVAVAFSRKFGEAGVKDYWYGIVEKIHAQNPEFGTEEFLQRKKARATEMVEDTTANILKLTELMHNHVVATIKSVHGDHILDSGEPAYWDKGVQNKDVRKRAYEKQQDDPEDRRQRKEAYLDTIHLKSIIEQENNWLHFQGIYNLPMEGEKKGKKFYTGWIGRLNDLRRIAAHKNELREYKDDDVEFVGWLAAELLPRLGVTDE